MTLRIKLTSMILCSVTFFAGFGASASEPLCLGQIRKSLINPETLQGFDFTALSTEQLNKFYDDVKSEQSSAALMLKLDCIEVLSPKCMGSRWMSYLKEQNSKAEAIEVVKSASDFRGFKMRTKAESRTGNTITSFHVCVIGGDKVSTIEIKG